MNYEEYISLGLNGDAPLKIIMRGSIQSESNDRIGVVSIIFITMDKELAKNKLDELNKTNKDTNDYYMVYSVPLDTDLVELEHYPSMAITKEDLL